MGRFTGGEELLPATRRALMHRVAAGQADGRAPSMTGAVLRSGQMAWCGVRRMSGGDEPADGTQYRIGSLTKTFAAVLVMRLRNEGLLDLADPLGKHLDAPQAQDATVAQLLSHTSGLAAEADGPWWERTPGELRPELADIFGERPRPHPAGRVFHYSNPGYALLGALVTRLRGRDWEQVLRQEILEPLGMTRTSVLPQPPHERGWAVHPWADVLQPEPAMDTGRMRPAADLWSTPADLCRFAAFLIGGDDRVLPAATLAEMRVPASGQDDPSGFGYGLGTQILHRDGRTLYGHLGSMPGFLCGLWVSPADGLGGIALANATSGPDPNGVAADLIKIVAEYEPPIPAPWRPLTEVDQALLALTGLWYWGPRAYVLRLIADRGLELGPATGRGRASQFRAQSDGTWTGLDGYYTGETLRLVRGTDGTVDHLDLGSFVFTREPYGPDGPLAARPDPEGWLAFLVRACSCGRNAAGDAASASHMGYLVGSVV
ncbi:MAG TPA: serine hydrolase domain-containing protein [Streptosporangiaceae bacterium]